MLTTDRTGIAALDDRRGHRVAAEFSSQRNTVAPLQTACGLAGLTEADGEPVLVQTGADSVPSPIVGPFDLTNFPIGSGVVAQSRQPDDRAPAVPPRRADE